MNEPETVQILDTRARGRDRDGRSRALGAVPRDARTSSVLGPVRRSPPPHLAPRLLDGVPMRRLLAPLLGLTALSLAGLVAPGCIAGAPDECDGPDDPACGVSADALRIAGSYVPDPEALRLGSAIVRYDDVPAWDGGAHCAGGITPGGRTLSTFLREHFDGISTIGGYSCRPNTANTSKMSVHGSGRALDIMIPLDGGDADNGVGDPIANWLIANSTTIGVQYLVWDRTQWSASRSTDRVRPYTGPIPHIDHIHVEITLPASRQETAFYTGGATTPTMPEAPPPTPLVDARFVGQGSTAAPDTTGAAQFTVCAGAPVEHWFEVEATSTATWVDAEDYTPGAWGRAIRLGVPSDMPDAFSGTTRVSVDDASNPEVRPGGADCNDAPGCRRTVFRLSGTAPATPGLHRTTWRLVDEWRAWFGPELWLSYRVTECATEPPPVAAVDADADGVDAAGDCDDADPGIHPGAVDVCADGIDADCDGVDPGCAAERFPTLDPELDDPGFDWAGGAPVYTTTTHHRIDGGCSASGARRGSPALFLAALAALAAFGRRRRQSPATSSASTMAQTGTD